MEVLEQELRLSTGASIVTSAARVVGIAPRIEERASDIDASTFLQAQPYTLGIDNRTRSAIINFFNLYQMTAAPEESSSAAQDVVTGAELQKAKIQAIVGSTAFSMYVSCLEPPLREGPTERYQLERPRAEDQFTHPYWTERIATDDSVRPYLAPHEVFAFVTGETALMSFMSVGGALGDDTALTVSGTAENRLLFVRPTEVQAAITQQLGPEASQQLALYRLNRINNRAGAAILRDRRANNPLRPIVLLPERPS